MPLALFIVLLLAAAPAYGQDGDGSGAGSVADSDPGTDPDTDAETAAVNTDTESGTGSDVVSATPGPPPKIATVVAGDPDETLRNTASFIEQEAVMAGMDAPSDPALRAALRGEAPTEEDGLEKLRSIRRSLGLDPRKDFASYRRIGLIAGADALVVVRREGLIRVEVFDVAAAQFYEGVLDFDTSSPETRVHFIQSRAEQAQLRWSAPPPPPPEKKVEVNPEEDKSDDSRAKKRWKKAWPYVLIGALLAGGVTYLIIDSRRAPESGPPLLRFTAGEE